MKKLLSMALLCAIAVISKAQYLNSTVNDANGDYPNLQMINPFAANTTGDIRSGIWMDNDGYVKFRNVTGYGFSFRNGYNTSDMMIINPNGHIGIGTATPLHTLVNTGTFLNVGADGGNYGVSYTSFTNGVYSALHSATPTEGVGMWSDNQGNASIGALYDNTASSLNLVVRGSSATNGLVGLKISGSGNVGIGTNTPTANLDVNTNAVIGAGGNKYNSALTLIKNGDVYGIDDPVLILKHSGNGVNTYSNPASDLGVLQIKGFNTGWANKSINSNDNFYVFTNGTVSVNTDHVPAGFNMAVNGNIIATAVTVKLYSAWPDYVFNPTYNLRPLSEVQTYIDQNHHLPDMPSEKEVAEKGLDLGEMNKLLTKKVEELTLYMIEKDKENTDLKLMLKDISSRLQQVEAKLQKDK